MNVSWVHTAEAGFARYPPHAPSPVPDFMYKHPGVVFLQTVVSLLVLVCSQLCCRGMLAIIVSTLILSAYADGNPATGPRLAQCNCLFASKSNPTDPVQLCPVHLAATDMSVPPDVVACFLFLVSQRIAFVSLILASILRLKTWTSMHRSSHCVSCRCCLINVFICHRMSVPSKK